MAGKTNDFETATMDYIFNNVAPNLHDFELGDNYGIRGSTTDGSLYIALFTASPAEDQSGVVANECDYTGYARVAVARTSAGWTVGTGTAVNASAITFGTCSAGTETATYFGICKAGARTVQDLIFYGLLSGSGLSISTGVTPQIQSGDITVTED